MRGLAAKRQGGSAARTGRERSHRVARACRGSSWARALTLASLVAVAGGPACRDGGLTEIIVVVDSDLQVPTQIDEIFVRVVGPSDLPKTAYAPLTGVGSASLPLTVGLVPKDGKASPVTIRASARRAGAEVLATEVRTSFVEGQRLVVRMSLLANCLSVAPTCGVGQTCRDGRCVDATVDPSTLPRFDNEDPRRRDMDAPRPGDAGTDADDGDGGMPDAGCSVDIQCDDGDVCNGHERCVEGRCTTGTPLRCDDGVACTTDDCDPSSGCRSVPDDGACTAGPGGRCDRTNGCQYTECTTRTCAPGPCESARCEGTMCVRTRLCASDQTCCAGMCVPAGCDDGNECTVDACGASGCENTPQPGRPCSDGNVCTTGDSCDSRGVCVQGPARSCDDGNPCTDDGCNPMVGCTATPNAAACSDGDPCTTGDRCSGGVCRSGAPCNDGVACTVDTCGGAGCVFTPMNSLCTAAPGGTCHATLGCQYPSCSPATCADTPCETAACEGTTCVRRPRVCADDGNPCTAEVCDAMVGCRSMPNVGAVCNDGDGCTENDRCTAAGMCMGTRRSCDDGNPCTTDTCDSAAGCVNTPRNGERCGGDECVPRYCDRFGSCIPRPVSCFDDNMFDCKHKECMDGVCVDVAAPAHTPCVEGMCSGECDGTSLMRCVVPPSGGGDQCL